MANSPAAQMASGLNPFASPLGLGGLALIGFFVLSDQQDEKLRRKDPNDCLQYLELAKGEGYASSAFCFLYSSIQDVKLIVTYLDFFGLIFDIIYSGILPLFV